MMKKTCRLLCQCVELFLQLAILHALGLYKCPLHHVLIAEIVSYGYDLCNMLQFSYVQCAVHLDL